MTTTREDHPLLPNTFYTTALETWVAEIQRLSSEAEQCFLKMVEHYKVLSDMEHEFLVVYASHPSGSEIVLGVDRNAQGSGGSRGTLVHARSLSPSSSKKESPHPAYDRVQVSHDGTPVPILAHHGPHVSLHTITFSPTSPLTASTSTPTSSNSDARRLPSPLHLSALLVTIRTRFPSYALLQYQCFVARATCLALMDLFDGVVMELKESKRVATWRDVHISHYSAGCTALKEIIRLVVTPPLEQVFLVFLTPPQLQGFLLSMLVALRRILMVVTTPVQQETLFSLVLSPWLLVLAGPYTMYSVVNPCEGKIVESEVDRRRISDEKIREHAIPDLYREARRSFA